MLTEKDAWRSIEGGTTGRQCPFICCPPQRSLNCFKGNLSNNLQRGQARCDEMVRHTRHFAPSLAASIFRTAVIFYIFAMAYALLDGCRMGVVTFETAREARGSAIDVDFKEVSFTTSASLAGSLLQKDKGRKN